MTRRWRETWDDFELWMGLNGFQREVGFRGLTGNRRWKWDFAITTTDGGLAVEYQGRHSERSGHTSIRGTRRDYEKANEGQLCGFTVLQCCAETITSGECQEWVEMALADLRLRYAESA